MLVICTKQVEAEEVHFINTVLEDIDIDQPRLELAAELYASEVVRLTMTDRSKFVGKLYGVCYPSSGIYTEWYVLVKSPC
jgi:hypothetical protein